MDYYYDRGIDTYLADGGIRGHNLLYKDRDRKKPMSRKRKYVKTSDFSYNEAENSCQCPARKLMRLSSDDYILSPEFEDPVLINRTTGIEVSLSLSSAKQWLKTLEPYFEKRAELSVVSKQSEAEIFNAMLTLCKANN